MMTHLLFSLIILLQGLLPVINQTSLPREMTDSRAAIVCLPGIYLVDPQDCMPLGPSAYLTFLASNGITLPLVTIPYRPVDPSLGVLPFSYAILDEERTPVFASLEDAMGGKNSIGEIAPGPLRYVTYIDYADTDNGRFFKRQDSTWLQVSSRVSVPHSYPGGIELSRTPTTSFGWILPYAPELESKRTPGYALEDSTGHTLSQYQIVQVYSTQLVNDTEWYLIAPDEWVEGRFIGRVLSNIVPPEGVTDGRWIEVNLAEQTMAVYDHNELVYATLIASGLDPFFTKPGLFQIERKLESTPMSGAFTEDRSDYYYLEDVPWTMYYDHARALHGAYWRTAFGFPQSHGCVNLAPADAHWLFDWAEVGDWVYVWDPSGNTPTDPEYYGEGGA
jgi:L,D-transpeptidase catalytic domain